MPQPTEKKKNSLRDMLLIVFVVIICFGLTILGIVFLTGKVFTSEEKIEIAKVQPSNAATDPEKGDILTFSSENETKPTSPMVEKPIVAPSVDVKPQPNVPAAKVEPIKPIITPPPARADTKPKDVILPEKKEPTKVEPKKEVKKVTPKNETKQANKKDAKPNRQTSTQLPSGKFAVQIMASKSLTAAEKEALNYRKACPDIYIQKSDLGEKGVWFRVRCGVTNSESEAERTRSKIEKQFNMKPIVVMNK